MYSVDCCPKGLVIGKQGENEAEKVVVDFSPWASEFGAGTISARLRRPKDSAAYPVILTTEGTTATWTVSATDTQYAGAGSLQLVYIVGDVVAKSVIWPVRVLPSLEEGEAPEPYESWLDTLEGLAADTQENARDAAASAADASASAEDAAQSAQSAAESAASITGLTAVAETLPEGSEASASFDSATDTLTLGIPRGDTGATGPAGPTGPKGDTGADGFSPSASVTKQDGNIVITVTDKDGTTSETLEVDDALDETSVNPVQNQAIQNALWNMLPVDTASGAIASFPDGADDVPMLSLKAQIKPVQEGSGDPSPTNVRPISGHTGVDVEHTGVNVWDEEWEVVSNRYIRSKNLIPVRPSTTYAFVSPKEPSNGFRYYDADKNIINTVYSLNGSFTTPANCYYVWFAITSAYGAIYNHDISINYPSTDHEYHAYHGTTYPISWQTEAGTVYGGTLDVVSGKLTVDRAMVTNQKLLTESTWERAGRGVFVIRSFTLPVSGANVVDTKLIATALPTSTQTDLYTNIKLGIAHWWNTVIGFSTGDSNISTLAAFREWLAENGSDMVYPLAEPIEYTLTAQEVKTYLGQNNIWNDAGDTEVTYRADIQKYIEKKVTS